MPLGVVYPRRGSRRCCTGYAHRIAAAVLLTLGLGACGDLGTEPEGAAGPPSSLSGVTATSASIAGAPGLASPYYCTTRRATPRGSGVYRQGRFELRFPSTVLAPNGATRSYTLRERAQNGTADYEAVCVIPATRTAAEMMHRHFGVSSADTSSGGGGEVGTLDYELEPIVVDGGNHCSNPDWVRGEDGVCRSSRGGGSTGGTGGDGGGGDPGGGGGSTPPGGGGDTCDPSLAEGGCEGDGSTFTSDGVAYGVDCPEYICPPEDPDEIQKNKYLEASKKIDQNKCPALYNAAVDRHASFKVWEAEYRVNPETREPDPNGVLVAGRYGAASEWISLWKGSFSRSNFPVILAHEAAHRLSHISGYNWNEKQTHQYALSCMLP